MTTRNQALAIIRYEYATHGQETRGAMRVSIESGVSYEAQMEARAEGLDMYIKKERV